MDKVPVVQGPRSGKSPANVIYVLISLFIVGFSILCIAVFAVANSGSLARTEDPLGAATARLTPPQQFVNVLTDHVPKEYPVAAPPFVAVTKKYDPAIIESSALPTAYADPAHIAEVKFIKPDPAELPIRNNLNAEPQNAGDVGLVVIDPVVNGSNELSMFGRSCGAWLDLTAAGQPLFGRTALYGRRRRIFTELGLNDLTLPVADVPKLASICGATDVAIGMLSGSESNCTLSYKLYSTRSGQPYGPPISETGSLAQIDAALPNIAIQLDKRLFVSTPEVPMSTCLRPDEMVSLGSLASQSQLKYSDYAQLFKMSKNSALAATILLQTSGVDDQIVLDRTVRTVIAQLPDNAMALSAIALSHSSALRPYASLVGSLAKKYPGSALLANVASSMEEQWGSREGQFDAALRATSDSPGDPENWVAASEAYFEVASDMRRGRLSTDISDEQWNVLNSLYLDAEHCAEHGAKLDPTCGDAWYELCETAEFAGHEVIARSAYTQSLKYEASTYDVDSWGLNLFQPKWANDINELKTVAVRAATRPYSSTDEMISMYQDLGCVSQALGDDQYQSLADAMLQHNIMEWRVWVSNNPDDPWANWGLASALAQETSRSSQREATLYYKCAAFRLPNCSELHYELSNVYKSRSMSVEQESELRRAIALNPFNESAHLALAILTESEKRYPEAVSEGNIAVRLDPSDSAAYYALATMYSNQNDYGPSVIQYRKAVALDPYDYSSFENMTDMLDRMGKYDESLLAGQRAVQILQDNELGTSAQAASVISNMEDDELHLKNWTQCLAYCNQVFSFSPGYPLSEENVAEAYWGEGQKAKAIAQWKLVVQTNDPWSANYARTFLKKYDPAEED